MSETPGGLYEALLTGRVQQLIDQLPDDRLAAEVGSLANAESADRVSRHIGRLLAQAIESMPERERATRAVQLAAEVIGHLQTITAGRDLGFAAEVPTAPAQVLRSILRLQPDGSRELIERPLTPLLDTTVLTNAHGEPAVAHELRAEIPSADGIDVLMAFIPLEWGPEYGRRAAAPCPDWPANADSHDDVHEQHRAACPRRIDSPWRAGAGSLMTRHLRALHAKAWTFHRASGYSTAYIGSSNLTHSAQVTGLEWNVRLSAALNPDAVAKMTAVFESYWASKDFIPYDADEFRQRTAADAPIELLLSPLEVVLRPFQEWLLDQIALARHMGHHRNLLVAATGTGKTVMAAVDYARLRATLPRDRLLFVAHRDEILDQSRNTFRHALRDGSFGEKWVGRERPMRFEHVFASIQSLNASGVERIEPQHFDVVIVDEFHHAAAPSVRSDARETSTP